MRFQKLFLALGVLCVCLGLGCGSQEEDQKKAIHEHRVVEREPTPNLITHTEPIAKQTSVIERVSTPSPTPTPTPTPYPTPTPTPIPELTPTPTPIPTLLTEPVIEAKYTPPSAMLFYDEFMEIYREKKDAEYISKLRTDPAGELIYNILFEANLTETDYGIQIPLKVDDAKKMQTKINNLIENYNSIIEDRSFVYKNTLEERMQKSRLTRKEIIALIKINIIIWVDDAKQKQSPALLLATVKEIKSHYHGTDFGFETNAFIDQYVFEEYKNLSNLINKINVSKRNDAIKSNESWPTEIKEAIMKGDLIVDMSLEQAQLSWYDYEWNRTKTIVDKYGKTEYWQTYKINNIGIDRFLENKEEYAKLRFINDKLILAEY